jgi:multiple sugar transport system substrate-binding protein
MLPLQANNRLIFDDRQMLADQGVTEPKTWDDFRKAAQRMTSRSGSEVTRWGYQTEPNIRFALIPFANRNGFTDWSAEGAKSLWGDQPMVDTVRYLLSLIDDDQTMINPLDKPIPDGVTGGLPRGLAAFVAVGPPSASSFVQQVPRLESDLSGFLYPPGPRVKDSYLVNGGQDLILFKTAQAQDLKAALELMRYLSVTRNVEYCKFNKTVYPVVKAAANDPQYSTGFWKAMWTNWNETKVPALPIGIPIPSTDDVTDPILTAIFRKQRGVQEGLTEVARLMTEAASQNRAAVEAFVKGST